MPALRQSKAVQTEFQEMALAVPFVPKNGYRFSTITATIFENTNVPLLVWFKVLYLMMTARRVFGPSNPSDLRNGFLPDGLVYVPSAPRQPARAEFRQLMGIVEVDELTLVAATETAIGIKRPTRLAVKLPVKLQSSAQSAAKVTWSVR